MVLAVTRVGGADEGVGEFDIPVVLPLTGAQVATLRGVAADLPEARGVIDEVAERAERLRGMAPTPLRVIHYEGLVHTDPRRVATCRSLSQMGDVAWLVRDWQLTGDERSAATLGRCVVAWSGAYVITGNDVNENKLYPLLVAYEALRPAFDDEDRAAVDRWVEELALTHLERAQGATRFSNRYVKRLRLLTVCARILDCDDWLDEVVASVERFVVHGLRPDGTSYDLEERDTLTYHCSALRPPLEIAMLLGEGADDLYAWTSPEGASIRKSVLYVLPYARGEKERREWRHSRVRLDHERAAAGLPGYQPGMLYDPRSSLEMFEQAAYFEPAFDAVVERLRGESAGVSWQTLMNRVVAQAREGN
ncbi:alginate lyase family protein [Mucisphaera calidilacus]|uniref:alginate lyase family protein n=1 Tax=Mucisphaera calidilacus TaxID=2527982 RepID=UPI001F2A74E0|nr:alginate lyase family protein [Mucisphaera calidilacus]